MREIQLPGGLVTFVDDEDYRAFSQTTWRVRSGGNRLYVVGRFNGRNAYLHRLIVDARERQEVDHIDGDSLNNQRSNLRFATRTQNMGNAKPRSGQKTSHYKGVSYDPIHHLWAWAATANGLRLRGYAKTEPEAALAYNEAAVRQFGAFARLNEVHEGGRVT